ncbi:hypothetical protein IWX90DRAFT_416273 [Phyllosticta citrichinensis]|uniref:Uncharacterized protein n=1 Tax=Phyllosticta citrichinensis TaxID=1130410 RepID=A0ABR1XS94_9PEZI
MVANTNDNGGQSPLFASPANASYCSSLGTPYPPISPSPAIIPTFPDGGCAPNMSPGTMTLLYRLPHPLSAVLPLLPSFGGSVPATAGELNAADVASVALNGSDSAPGTARRYTGDGGDAEGNFFVDTLTEWQAPRHGDQGAGQTPLVVVYSVAPMSLNVSALVSPTSPPSSLTGVAASGNAAAGSSSSSSSGGGGGIGGAAIAAAGGAGAAAALLSNADTSARPDPYRPFPDEAVIGVYAAAHALVVAPDCGGPGNSLWNYTVRFCATNAPTAARWFRERSLRGVRGVAARLGGDDGGDAAVLDERVGTGCEASRTAATGPGSEGAGGGGGAAAAAAAGSNTSVSIPGPTGRETGAASSKGYSARMSMGAAVTLAVAGSIAFAAMMV